MRTGNRKNTVKRVFASFAAAVMLLTAATPQEALAAAKTATVTRSYAPMYADCIFKCLVMYGKDTFTITYDKSTKKIISCRAVQSAKNLGTDMIGKGGIRLESKTARTWTYKATWYLNFSILPKPVQLVGRVIKSKLAALSSLGRICTVTVTYKVSANCLQRTMKSKFQVPSRIQSAARYVGGMFTVAF